MSVQSTGWKIGLRMFILADALKTLRHLHSQVQERQQELDEVVEKLSIEFREDHSVEIQTSHDNVQCVYIIVLSLAGR